MLNISHSMQKLFFCFLLKNLDCNWWEVASGIKQVLLTSVAALGSLASPFFSTFSEETKH